jgi:hypothetical protein
MRLRGPAIAGLAMLRAQMVLLLWRQADLSNLVSYHYLSGWHALARCGSGAIAAAWSELLTDHNGSS